MRIVIVLLLACAACTNAPVQLPTADMFRQGFLDFAVFVTPDPVTVLPGINLPLRAGDRVIANCAQAYEHTLPEMTPEEQADFNANVTCIMPPDAEFQQSAQHYNRALAARGFKDDTGDYVQSAMRIACNETHTVAMSMQSNFIPRVVMNQETEEMIDVEGGGELANMALAFSVSERPCEDIAVMRDLSDPPAPEKYADRPAPNYLAATQIELAGNVLPLRPGDRLIAHCAQYYATEWPLPPAAFADVNRSHACVAVQGDIKDAAAHYLRALADAGFDRDAPWAAPHPDMNAEEATAGVYAWSGVLTRCAVDRSVRLGAVARIGRMKLLDPLTAEVWTTRRPFGGRETLLSGAETPNAALIIEFTPVMGCPASK